MYFPQIRDSSLRIPWLPKSLQNLHFRQAVPPLSPYPLPWEHKSTAPSNRIQLITFWTVQQLGIFLGPAWHYVYIHIWIHLLHNELFLVFMGKALHFITVCVCNCLVFAVMCIKVYYKVYLQQCVWLYSAVCLMCMYTIRCMYTVYTDVLQCTV